MRIVIVANIDMGELEPITSGQTEMAPVVVIGGVLTRARMHHLYKGFLGTAELPANQRFIPIPMEVLGPPDQMIEYFDEQFLSVQEAIGEPVVAVGHSLGGLAAELAGIRHPDKVRAVVTVAGAHEGFANMTPSMGLLQTIINRPREAAEMYHGSDFIQGHRQRVASEWSEDVPHHSISPTFDDLLPAPQGLNVELPAGQAANRYVAAPSNGLILNRLRRVHGMPIDVQILRSRLTTHYEIPLAPAVIRHIRDVRRVAAANDPLATVISHPHLFDAHHLWGRPAWELKTVCQEVPIAA